MWIGAEPGPQLASRYVSENRELRSVERAAQSAPVGTPGKRRFSLFYQKLASRRCVVPVQR